MTHISQHRMTQKPSVTCVKLNGWDVEIWNQPLLVTTLAKWGLIHQYVLPNLFVKLENVGCSESKCHWMEFHQTDSLHLDTLYVCHCSLSDPYSIYNSAGDMASIYRIIIWTGTLMYIYKMMFPIYSKGRMSLVEKKWEQDGASTNCTRYQS
jgi:hypothetical protein